MIVGDKAEYRIKHWLKHNEVHLQQYEKFADELELARSVDSASHIRRIAALLGQVTDHLYDALHSLPSK